MPDGVTLFVPLALLLAVGCGAGEPAPLQDTPAAAKRYVEDGAFRRATLESQLVVTTNAYAFERLREYGRPSWDALPIEPLAQGGDWPDMQAPSGLPALLTLGRRAFFEYPARVGAEFGPGLDRGMPNAWRAPDGSGRAVITCATCHTGPDGVVGAPNTALDIGAIYAEAFGTPDEPTLLRWGPGRMDVTSDTADDPVRIADVRQVRHQRLLQSAGAVRQRSPVDLAIRLETLLITASGRRTRPPRATMAALAWWLHTLGSAANEDAAPAVFVDRCGRCHDPGGAYASALPIPVQDVGTAAAAAWSPGRGTGGYKAPSLIGVAERRPLFHDASQPGLDAVLDPDRSAGGHLFTAGLTGEEVAQLRAFLSATSR